MEETKNKNRRDKELLKDEIQKRAYEIYLQKGEDGDDVKNWLQAEEEIFKKYNIYQKEEEIKRGGLKNKKAISEDKTSIKEVKQETQDLTKALGSYTADQRDEAIERT